MVTLNGPPAKLFVVPESREDIDWLAPELITTVNESSVAEPNGPTLICASEGQQSTITDKIKTQEPLNQDPQHRAVSIAGNFILCVSIMSPSDTLCNSDYRNRVSQA